MPDMTRAPAALTMPVETVMTRRIVQIVEQIPMSEVRNIAAKYDYNGYPVVTTEGRLVGMVTKGDLLRVACAALEDPEVWQEPVSRFMARSASSSSASCVNSSLQSSSVNKC